MRPQPWSRARNQKLNAQPLPEAGETRFGQKRGDGDLHGLLFMGNVTQWPRLRLRASPFRKAAGNSSPPVRTEARRAAKRNPAEKAALALEQTKPAHDTVVRTFSRHSTRELDGETSRIDASSRCGVP